MRHEVHGRFEHDGEWVVAHRLEVPGANGQGRTKDEARPSLIDAIALILEDRQDDGLLGVPEDAERETIERSRHNRRVERSRRQRRDGA